MKKNNPLQKNKNPKQKTTTQNQVIKEITLNRKQEETQNSLEKT